MKKNPLTHEDALVFLRFLQDNPASGLTCLDLSVSIFHHGYLSTTIYMIEELEEIKFTQVYTNII